MATTDLKVGQTLDLVAEQLDAKGNVVHGPLVWQVSDPSVLTLVVSADGESAMVGAEGKLGDCKVTASLASVTSDPFDVNAIAGDVVSIKLSVKA